MSKEEKIVGQCKSSVSKEVEELLKKIEEKEKIIRKYELLLDRFKISDKQDNANPSEALEEVSKGSLLYHLYKCFEDFVSQEYPFFSYEFDKFKANDFIKSINTIKQALLKAQEQEKVLKIVFEKKIDVNNFQTSLMVMSNFTYRYYINNSRDYHTCIMVKLLEEDEFNLLKRYCNEQD